MIDEFSLPGPIHMGMEVGFSDYSLSLGDSHGYILGIDMSTPSPLKY
jgi:hypothetical protein